MILQSKDSYAQTIHAHWRRRVEYPSKFTPLNVRRTDPHAMTPTQWLLMFVLIVMATAVIWHQIGIWAAR